MIPITCPCCEVSHPPHRDGCTLHHDCPNEAELFDEVSSMRAEIARLHDERRWIPVTQRPPDDGATIFASDGDAVAEVRYFHGYGFECLGGDELTFTATHWMKKPAPPNGMEGE